MIIRVIFRELAKPGMTPIRVMRYCRNNGVVFPAFPPEWNTKVNRKTFVRGRKNPDGSWIISVHRVRSITQNPAYIGWKIWDGEVVSKNVYPPIIDEETFWTVQKKFQKPRNSPKKDLDPLPLGGLLYCGNHEIPRKMYYSNGGPARVSFYECCDHSIREYCGNMSIHILKPIEEAVISQIALPDLADKILHKLVDEYQEAEAQTDSYRREKKINITPN